MPDAPVVHGKPEVFHPERDTEKWEMFDTPSPLGSRASQILPINQMELLFLSEDPQRKEKMRDLSLFKMDDGIGYRAHQ